MARKNRVTLWGKVINEPMISQDPVTLELKKASFFMMVMNQDRDNGIDEGGVMYSQPFVYTENPEMIKEISTWKQGDLVDVRGVLTTVDAKRAAICTNCNNKIVKDGEVTLITPLFIEKRYSGADLTEKESAEIIRNHREVSNLVELSGSLCADPREQKKAKFYQI